MKATIRVLSVLLLLTLLFFVVVGWTAFDPWLPKGLLNQYLESLDSSEPAYLSSIPFLIFDAALMFLYIASLIGVFFFSRIARITYIISVVLALLYSFWPTVHIVSAPMAFIDSIFTLATGMLLVLVCSPSYLRRAEQDAAANP